MAGNLWTNILSIFDWKKNKSIQDTQHPAKREVRRPQEIDLTDNRQANQDLTRGLFHNSYPGLKLAGGLARTPIMVPLWFMGLPVIRNTDESENDLISRYSGECRKIHLQCHREGTVWIWPHFSAKMGRVVWEFIPDYVITDIVRDIDTLEPVIIHTDELITITTDYNKVATVRRHRKFEIGRVTVEWSQGQNIVSGELRNYTIRNVGEVLPIPFSNNADGDEIRGHSDYELILPDLKSYHDIELKSDELLAKFNPKWVQYVSDWTEWKETNAITDINEINVAGFDFIIDMYDKEKTEILFPDRAYDSYSKAKADKIQKLIKGSTIPELCWGGAITGNLGSYESQLDTLVKFVEDKRSQKTKPYKKLFDATIKLERIANIEAPVVPDYKIEWNALDSISEATKATIFRDFTQGVNYLITSAGATPEMLHKIWNKTFPDATPDNFEEFRAGLTEMAKIKAFANADYEVILDNNNNNGKVNDNGRVQ